MMSSRSRRSLDPHGRWLARRSRSPKLTNDPPQTHVVTRVARRQHRGSYRDRPLPAREGRLDPGRQRQRLPLGLLPRLYRRQGQVSVAGWQPRNSPVPVLGVDRLRHGRRAHQEIERLPEEMGVFPSIVDLALNTRSEEMYYLTAADLGTYRVGKILPSSREADHRRKGPRPLWRSIQVGGNVDGGLSRNIGERSFAAAGSGVRIGFDEAESVHQPHLFDPVAWRFQEPRIGDNHCERTGA
jgi:hypothetical protein